MISKKKKNELYHHGIQGQKWGKRNGPPYPLKPEVSQKVKKEGQARKDAEYQKKRDKLEKTGKGKTEKGSYDDSWKDRRGFDDYLISNRRERQEEWDRVNATLDRIKNRQLERQRQRAYEFQADQMVESILSKNSEKLNQRYSDMISEYKDRNTDHSLDYLKNFKF